MTTKETAVQLEGWLPGEERNGLIRIGKDSMDAFNVAYDAGDDTTAATLQVVVGLVEVTKVNRRHHREEKPPVVAYRFLHLEVAPSDLEETLRTILDTLHADRTGNDPLPGMSGGDEDDDGEDLVDSTGGDRTDRVPDIGPGSSTRKAAKKAVRRRRTAPGQTPRH